MIVNSQYNTVQNGSLGAIKIHIAEANKPTSLSNLTPGSNALQGSYNTFVVIGHVLCGRELGGYALIGALAG